MVPSNGTNRRVSWFTISSGCFRISVNNHGGRVAQLGEHLLCKQGVGGSSPLTSTNLTNHIENDEFGHDTQALALIDSRHGKRMAIPAGQDAIPHASFYFWSLRPRFIFSGSGECPWCAKKKG